MERLTEADSPKDFCEFDDPEEFEGAAYTGFAQVYDEFMDNIPYDEWVDYLAGLLEDHGIHDGIIAELGCGTGSVTERLSARGYDMIGIDNSEEMLMIAREKAPVDSGILYLEQDMRSFELFGTVRAVVSICDSMNYLLTDHDLVQVMKLVNNYLDPGGLFIFDLKTVFNYQEILGTQVFAENREDNSYIWVNSYDPETRINQYDLTLFVQEYEDEEDLFRRYEETHYQKAWTLDEIMKAADEAGMRFLKAYHAFSREDPRPESERIYVILQEQGK
ncbi:MAG: class I SAM-dependent methyltransferase [Lachnospiraceae bacterium]|nr:class I SAM-dependent methyltransferase [Lachnospiraceae bacterium]